jgi:hypothetical protein
MFSRNKEDEIEYLKESLRNAKSELEREKLLNAAVKQKRVISLCLCKTRNTFI